MEGQYKAKSGTLVDLSEQQLIDCAGKAGGCEGGLLDMSLYDYIKKYGIEKASDYPFTGAVSNPQTMCQVVSIKCDYICNTQLGIQL